MLEHSSLLVHAWSRRTETDGGPVWMRHVTDAAGRRLGFVQLDGAPRGSWLSWFRKLRLDVFETEDASHLMTVTRSWGMLRIWEVDDADARHVGTVYSRSLVSSEGEPLAWIDGVHGRLLDAAGKPLATIAKKAAAVELTFAPALASNPFLRMLMLGCALAQEPAPGK